MDLSFRSIILKLFKLILHLGLQVPECPQGSQSSHPSHLAVPFLLQVGWTQATFKLLKILMEGDYRDLLKRTSSLTYLLAVCCRMPWRRKWRIMNLINVLGRWGIWHMVSLCQSLCLSHHLLLSFCASACFIMLYHAPIIWSLSAFQRLL